MRSASEGFISKQYAQNTMYCKRSTEILKIQREQNKEKELSGFWV